MTREETYKMALRYIRLEITEAGSPPVQLWKRLDKIVAEIDRVLLLPPLKTKSRNAPEEMQDPVSWPSFNDLAPPEKT